MALPGASATWKTLPVGGEKVPVIPYRCTTCSKPIKQRFAQLTGACAGCNKAADVTFRPPGISRAWALTAYVQDDDAFPGNVLVHRGKVDGATSAAIMAVSAAVWKALAPWHGEGWTADCVVPCPSSRERAFPRSYQMGKAVADMLALRVDDILVRTDQHPPRSGTSHKTAPNSFEDVLNEVTIEVRGDFMPGQRVLLVDDLLTQGVTAASAAYSLRSRGATDVRLLSFARWTDKGHLERFCD